MIDTAGNSSPIRDEEKTPRTTRIQMTIEMVPAKIPPKSPSKKIERKYHIELKSNNLIDQLSLLTGRTKQDLVSDAIKIIAVMYKKDPEVLEEWFDSLDSI